MSMAQQPWQDRSIALAGLVQAAAAVQQVAREGRVRDDDTATVLLESVLELNPASVEATYGDRHRLALGLRMLLQQIGATRDKDVEITRYVVSLLALSRKALRNETIMRELGERLQQVNRQRNDFGFSDDTIVSSLASIYVDLISPLSAPLRINGKPTHLQQRAVQNQIRALLLAGIRAAVLWQQIGGKRRHFIFSRQRMVQATRQLLQTSSTHLEKPE